MRPAISLLVLAAALMAGPTFGQGTVPMNQCAGCKWMMPFQKACATRGITDQRVMLDNGVAWFFFGKTAEDGAWLKTQFAQFGKAISTPDAKFCEYCAPIAAYAMNPKSASEFVPTKTGLMFLMTSKDMAANEAIRAHMKKLMEAQSKMQKDNGCCDPSAPAPTDGKFLGKGDGVDTCPVTGEKVDKSVSAVINGRTVYFCCPGCMSRVKAHPELYLKK